jgi:hypothetical protein
MLVLEYNNNFVQGGGQQGFLTVRRTYGTATVACQPSKDCGDGSTDALAGEACDTSGMDMAGCNGLTCQLSTCGDGYVNAQLENCESNGVDTPTCNGASGAARCLTPTCGDTHVNAATGEVCDELVDTPTCNGVDAVKTDGSGINVGCTAVTCGDHYTNTAAEECDTGGFDTGECNGATPGLPASCKRTRCGDGYPNLVPVDQGGPGEECDEGEDAAGCNGPNAIAADGTDVSCKPAMCGDGYANAANDEECDGDELCDDSCRLSFKLGGGCGGCTSNTEAGWILGFCVGALVLRRRRYNSRRIS